MYELYDVSFSVERFVLNFGVNLNQCEFLEIIKNLFSKVIFNNDVFGFPCERGRCILNTHYSPE